MPIKAKQEPKKSPVAIGNDCNAAIKKNNKYAHITSKVSTRWGPIEKARIGWKDRASTSSAPSSPNSASTVKESSQIPTKIGRRSLPTDWTEALQQFKIKKSLSSISGSSGIRSIPE